MDNPRPSADAAPGRRVRNVLFIMCDQLRADHLGCYGGAGALTTPHIDRLAAQGARFDRAYVTSAVCGPSRTSFYTGRYPVSHRVTWNRVPLPIDEMSLGDYLAPAGLECALLGKTHVVPHRAALQERGLQLDDAAARTRFLEGGFTPVERYDGHFEMAADSPYRAYLLSRGYASERPWTDHVIGSLGPDGQEANGWLLRHAGLPARVREEDSETAYLTTRAIDHIRGRGEQPWVLHLSYIKPHWPYKAPAPYHAMYAADYLPAPVRGRAEREHPHPVQAAYQRLEESVSFARDEVWRTVRPVYAGLVKQIDDQIGRLMAALQEQGRLEDTLIIFTADHGDFLGDHWLGEKEVFFEPVQRVPFIVRDPLAAPGQVRQDFVECIDVVPTVLQALGLPLPSHRLEGHGLLPLLRGEVPALEREAVFGSLDYAYREARQFLGRQPHECTGWMVRDARHKLIIWEGFAPQLFDLHDDPQELHDLGADLAHEPVRRRLKDQLLDWMLQRRRRATETTAQVQDRTHAHERLMNILIGRW
ncbi:MAG: sulfatase-like hydrolase/transferase [Rubrivivax sp.]